MKERKASEQGFFFSCPVVREVMQAVHPLLDKWRECNFSVRNKNDFPFTHVNDHSSEQTGNNLNPKINMLVKHFIHL